MNKSEKVQTYLKQQSGLFGRELFLKDLGSYNNNLYSNTENKESSKKISQLYESISIHKKESIGGSSNQFVFGVGDPNADLMLIGEAPGEKEDIIGEPFIGRSGKLLNKLLSAININLSSFLILLTS